MTAQAQAPDQAAAKESAAAQGQRMVRLLEERGYLAEILGSDAATVERFRTVMLSAITSNPKLLSADQASLVQAMRESAMWGLEPDGVDAVIVPFWSSKRSRYEADFQPTARGYVQVLYRSPRVRFVDADVVYANDFFEYEKGAVPRLVHRPLVFGDRGARLGAYAIVQLDSGFVRPIVLNEKDIAARRKVSRESETGTWAEWPDEMARKTALRSIMSLVPIARGVKAALAAESEKYQAVGPGEAPIVAQIAAPAAAQLPALSAARGAFLGLPEGDTVVQPANEPRQPRARKSAPAQEAPQQPQEPEAAPDASPEAEEAVAVALCDAESDPALGDVERCAMPAGHLEDPKAPRIHRSESGTTFPAAKGGAR